MNAELETIARALDEAKLLVERRGAFPATVSGITDDSRAVQPGNLFVAVRGSERDGHDYLAAAAKAGAVAAVVQDPSRTELPSLVVNDGRRGAAIAASAAYGWPARELQLVAVTGTNGKTTTVNMLRHILAAGGARTASIGTLGVLVGNDVESVEGASGGLTTPGPVELQRVFRALVDRRVSRVAMEVSSHSLDQRRIEGVFFDVVTFTNFTRDHLDYHGSMDKYFAAKARLLDHLRPHGTVVSNLDDVAWGGLRTERRRVGFSARVPNAEVHAENIRFSARGSQWTLWLNEDKLDVALPLIGDFNVINAVGAAATAYALGLSSSRIGERLSTMPQVPGRLEVLSESPAVLRDYAHTPDALARALDAVRPFAKERLIVVFGCGGDRDRGKRPEMGSIAETKADIAIVTSDNPRTEDPETILDDIERGMLKQNHERIEDRRAAIARALEIATPSDVVILAGKGHETYQVRGNTRLPFDEKIVVSELMSADATAKS
jgi:UDP-N-acetylmuramoyl-L-alanyl-D-glutamate--2,6-diaminopimelate ligase